MTPQNTTKICDFCGDSSKQLYFRNVEGIRFVCDECLEQYYINLDMNRNYIGPPEIYI